MEFIKAIIRPSYWITHQSVVPEQWQLALTVFFGVLLAFGLVALLFSVMKKFRKPYRTLFSKFSAWSWTMGLLGYALLFFSVQQVAYASVRLNYLLWLGLAVWWIYYIIGYAVKDVPRLIEGQHRKEKIEKYLPRKRR